MSKTILKSGFVLERRKIKYGRKLESYALQVSFYRCIFDNTYQSLIWRTLLSVLSAQAAFLAEYILAVSGGTAVL